LLKLAQKVFSLESAHDAHVVQGLDGLNDLMLVESSFMLFSKRLDFAGHNIH
jgi:hypothetical protein